MAPAAARVGERAGHGAPTRIGSARRHRSAPWIMITNSAFTVEPWAVRERDLEMGTLARTEPVFAHESSNMTLKDAHIALTKFFTRAD